MKHTPGPWKVTKLGTMVRAGGTNIADCGSSFNLRYKHEEMHANAALIASAPDLLEALEALFANQHVHPTDFIYDVREREGLGWEGPSVTQWSDAIAKAKAAIAKAHNLANQD